ncbi:CPBP family intramembrane metalloprotease [Staphylococcus sp. NRL 16/872]|uniref:CPBP family intramembrane glutamic endopeptidase n=1 Tax=Staphylococcus sp. NRL 16/872 TaxID=2930131 RepID=UPI001FB519CA|nr:MULTISPECIES: CPBP family intramembrane glutamic endopeptidase [unclassified Staphylococcus]MCJ1655363.1 CPBP family intramembrane metalloprotease [Staphylococcus sp. NRL 21/187]MCJ1661199.1 CPBP family intramembrane metalloprotease [Staphylococcus sp. NRL 18/288]MCJ1667088.1 CPBP family intramembrane metalloprotease [Staphylococcus sp. NRL 19/737]WEN69566.1 CPBP family intramembrane metalloprotease [Staphylococcus sp. NRL 16/872]
MSQERLNQQTKKADFQISHKAYWKLLLQSIFMIVVMLFAESMVLALVEESPKHFWVAIVSVIIAFLLLWLFKLKLFNFSKITKQQWMLIIIGFALMTGVDYLLSFFMPEPSNEKGLEEDYNKIPFLLQIASIGTLGPILEEVVFRGLLIKGIFRGAPIIGGIVSVILFAGSHGPTTIGEWFVYGFSGLIFVFAYLKTGRLEVAILIHILNNTLVTIQNHFW